VTNNDAVATSTDGTARALGGGVSVSVGNGDPVDLTSSRVSGNLAKASSGGTLDFAGGGGVSTSSDGDLRVTGSTLDANRALVIGTASDPQAAGGGLLAQNNSTDTTAVLTNSTVTGNSIAAGGTSPVAQGAGLSNLGAKLSLRFVTVARNTADGISSGGGVYTDSAGTSAIVGTILARNDAASGKDCSGAVSTFGGNVFGGTGGCAVTLAASDRVKKDSGLGALGDHGGATPTIPLKGTSAALNLLAESVCHQVTTVDQRGVHRPQGKKCDSGAYERKT
jgi:hypothetical protein